MIGKFVKSWQSDVRDRIFEWVEHGELIAAHGFVLLRLMEYADYDTGKNARPGLDRLAANTSMSASTVARALQDGRDLLLIEETQHGGGSGPNRKASVFRFLSPVLKNQTATPRTAASRTRTRTPASTSIRTNVTTSGSRAVPPTRPTGSTRSTKTSIPTSNGESVKQLGSQTEGAERNKGLTVRESRYRLLRRNGQFIRVLRNQDDRFDQQRTYPDEDHLDDDN